MGKQLIISCEHAGNEVPEEYDHLFKDASDVLDTHRGIDIGALELTNSIAEKMKQEPYLHTITRLLVDLNRSVQSPTLFSEFTEEQPLDIREDIFDKYYRHKVEERVKDILDQGDQAIHVGVHTFTPVWDEVEREVDVGFLYDPTRKNADKFCHLWRKKLDARTSGLRLKMNEPYRGTMDGFTTYLRRNYSVDQYMGMEIEVSQYFSQRASQKEWEQLQKDVANSLHSSLQDFR